MQMLFFDSKCDCKKDDYIEISSAKMERMCDTILKHKNEILDDFREKNIELLPIIKTTPKWKLHKWVIAWNKRKETVEEAKDRLQKEADDSLPDFPLIYYYDGKIKRLPKTINLDIIDSLDRFSAIRRNPYTTKTTDAEYLAKGFKSDCKMAHNFIITKENFRILSEALAVVDKLQKDNNNV